VSAYRFIAAERANHPVRLMCRVLGVSPSGFYDWCRRPPSPRWLADRQLANEIAQIHERSRRTYGAPRITAELRARGICVSRKRVARLMRAARLQGVHLRTWRGPRAPARRGAPDLLRRHFSAPARDRTWVGDITYVPTRAGWTHLAVVLDLHSRKVVGWSTARHERTELVIRALDMAIENRRPGPGLVHHSDRGAQYTSEWFGRYPRARGIAGSMGRPGTAYDNAVAESFFATIKREHLRRFRFRTHAEATQVIGEWIENFYNRERRHSYLGQLSPAEFEVRSEVST
jgi:putative transposase